MTLTQAQALEIRAAYLAGATEHELAAEFNISPRIAKNIATATHWKQISHHLTDSFVKPNKLRKRTPKR